MTIYKTEMYSDDFNRNVIEKKNIADNTSSLMGSVIIQTAQNGNIPVEFPFEDSQISIEKAFEIFDEVLKNHIKKKQDEAQAQAQAMQAQAEAQTSEVVEPPQPEIG